MEILNYYFDEAGYQGKLKSSFNYNELSILGGFVISQKDSDYFEISLNKILSNLNVSGIKKRHATELLKNEENHKVRDELFEFLKKSNNWSLVFTALYPLGVYPYYTNNREKRFIYKFLLESNIHMLDEMCRVKNCDGLVMISDHIDKGILKEAERILNKTKQKERIVKNFKKHVVKFIPNSDFLVKTINSIQVSKEENNLILTADFLINHIYRFLRDKITKEQKPLPLHSKHTYSNYIFRDKIFFLYENDDILYDKIFKPEVETK